ncbi:UDP-glucuronosyltransferase 2B13-like, partial [Drosophila montana]|uniref:UDP-glucuronosyltransferase 2B13-like n=1 Tax=Drosophila montana TaxID=40370 RepID=UPI00313D4AC6
CIGRRWFPQTDILAQPNVKLFITHRGLLSTIDSIYFGKPVLGLPVFYVQHLNVERAKQAGFGLALDLWTMTAGQLHDQVVQLLSNSSYTQAAQLRSKLFRDQNDTPLERSIWRTEYVLRHHGAQHLRSASRDLSLAQLHGLDTWGLFCGVTSLIALVFVFVISALLRVLRYILCRHCKIDAKQKIQ